MDFQSVCSSALIKNFCGYIFLSWTESGRDKFLLSTYWCSSVSELLFLWKPDFLSCKQNNYSAPLFFLYSSLPGKEICAEKLYSRPQLWRLKNSQNLYFLYWFSTSKVSLGFNYLYFICFDLCLMVDLADTYAYFRHIFLFA